MPSSKGISDPADVLGALQAFKDLTVLGRRIRVAISLLIGLPVAELLQVRTARQTSPPGLGPTPVHDLRDQTRVLQLHISRRNIHLLRDARAQSRIATRKLFAPGADLLSAHSSRLQLLCLAQDVFLKNSEVKEDGLRIQLPAADDDLAWVQDSEIIEGGSPLDREFCQPIPDPHSRQGGPVHDTAYTPRKQPRQCRTHTRDNLRKPLLLRLRRTLVLLAAVLLLLLLLVRVLVLRAAAVLPGTLMRVLLLVPGLRRVAVAVLAVLVLRFPVATVSLGRAAGPVTVLGLLGPRRGVLVVVLVLGLLRIVVLGPVRLRVFALGLLRTTAVVFGPGVPVPVLRGGGILVGLRLARLLRLGLRLRPRFRLRFRFGGRGGLGVRFFGRVLRAAVPVLGRRLGAGGLLRLALVGPGRLRVRVGLPVGGLLVLGLLRAPALRVLAARTPTSPRLAELVLGEFGRDASQAAADLATYLPIWLRRAWYRTSRRATTPAATALAKRMPAPPMRTALSQVRTASRELRMRSAPQAVRIASMTAITQPAPGMSFATTFVITNSPMMSGS